MTQMEQANVRVNVVTSALVAAAVSATITISGLAIASSIDLGAQAQAPAADGGFQRLVVAERAWEAQRRVQSTSAIRYEHYLQRLGAEWQDRYEQTNPNR